MMFLQEPRLAFLVFLPLPVLIILGLNYAKVSKRNWKAVREASGELLFSKKTTGQSLDTGICTKSRERNRFNKIGKVLEKRSLEAMYRWSIQGPGASFLSSLGILAVVGMGAHLLQTEPTFTSGKFFAFLLYTNMFYEPVRQLVSINNLIAAGKASGERVFEVLDTPNEINNHDKPLTFPKKLKNIEFERVSFSYDERSALIEDLSFTIRRITTALVGQLVQESTAATLLRYYSYRRTSGIGNENLEKLSLLLEVNIGLVAQTLSLTQP